MRACKSPPLSDETLRERLKRVLLGMRQQGLDALIIYADKEHGGNFEYLSGFIPRFEEALLIVAKHGAATGDRFEQARLYPSDKKIALGDKLSLTTGFKGGLSSRAAYVVKHREMLPAKTNDYLERVAIPYYHAVVCWLTALRVGITGGEVYALIEDVLPKERFHWHLNPGHLVADEEWLCSPISQNSPVALASGMLLQIDIIPSVAGYAGASIEDTVALADADLRAELACAYPALWQRILTRRTYLEEVLHIPLHADVLPMSNTVGYLRPFLLDKQKALVCGR